MTNGSSMEKSKAVNTCFTIAHAESASGARNKTQETIKKRKVKSHATTLLHAVFRDKAECPFNEREKSFWTMSHTPWSAPQEKNNHETPCQ